ncbi:Sphingosine N-acyltransferase lag1 [Lithohypha guttulata]|uniref:Sphingosine N-acyltransferase lag1 n=1 Tax=Lithohypha guttulata TaxID=1690604 RepID=UPI002DDFD3FE|nr:Sphingosine N-acyltransferase lag1 [Lithohypha guttulata]KAK5099335.1 Sphingosine N-acyltransferase lag1 [Lithohypha guttulata]
MATHSESRSTDRENLSVAQVIPHRQHNESPSQKTAMPRWPRWRPKGSETSSVARACRWVVDRQISISLNFVGLLCFAHMFFPQTQHHTQKFFRISYLNESTGKYALGWDDIFFVFYWIIVFTGLRCISMDYILSPLAEACGIRKKKAKVRFAEQAWILIYPAFTWTTGMYIYYHSDYWLNLRALWRDWPVREMDGLTKWYYLVQFAFWLQQIVVVNIEERRKDHWQMFSHHVVTCALIFCSYGYHQSKVGNLILCLMDLVDIILPAAKLLKYLRFQTTCDIMFGIFMVSWFITRHILYVWVCWSIYAHIPEEIQYGCYKGSTQDLQGPFPTPNNWVHLTWPFRDPVGLVCWNNNIKWGFLGMLLALQVILCMWFIMIVRVAYKVVTGQGADDSRSDVEDEDDEEEEEEEGLVSKRNLMDKVNTCIDPKPFVDTAALQRSGRPHTPLHKSSRRKDGSGHSSGINVLGSSSDRKELLGRIGCEKPTN